MNLSIVIPVYNAEDFIKKSYQSIIDQKINDFEIIYVNNNSTDTSEKQIKVLIRKDKRVKLLFQKKQGAAPARNLGIKHAKGKYVYVFDVDDEIYPDSLNTMIRVLDDYPNIAAVFGKMVKSNNCLANTLKPDDETLEIIFKPKPFWGLLWFKDLSAVVGPPAFLYRKTTLENLGFYNEELKNNEDTALDIKLGIMYNIAYIDKYVYLYYKHSDSTIEQSKRKTPRTFMMWPRLVKEHLPFYLNHRNETEFGVILINKLLANIGTQLYFTKGYKPRLALKKKLRLDIKPVDLPLIVEIYLFVFVLTPTRTGLKFYKYYVVPFTAKQTKIN